MKIQTILHYSKLYKACLNLKFGGTEKLFDVLTMNEILGACKRG
jgi:hypothetical protein